jgi:hypothetical protein
MSTCTDFTADIVIFSTNFVARILSFTIFMVIIIIIISYTYIITFVIYIKHILLLNN